MSLFILILPVIGLMERHGLRERAEILIGKINAATAGRIFMIYSICAPSNSCLLVLICPVWLPWFVH